MEARVLNLLRVFLYKLQNFKLEEFSIKLIAETFHFADVDVIYPKVPIHILATSNLFRYFVTQPPIKDLPEGPGLLAQVELFATCGGMAGEHLEKVAGVQVVVVVHLAEPGLLYVLLNRCSG